MRSPTLLFLFSLCGVTLVHSSVFQNTHAFVFPDDDIPTMMEEGLESGIRIKMEDNIAGQRKSRHRRATYDDDLYNWPHRIPFKFHPGFPDRFRPIVKRTLTDLMKHVCVQWIEEPRFDPYNNTYDTNALLGFVMERRDPYAHPGDLNGDPSVRMINVVAIWGTILHEILHTLGTLHEFSGPYRDQHVNIVYNNIEPSSHHNFAIASSRNTFTSEFDGSSVMMYGQLSGSVNGMETILPLRDETFQLDSGKHLNSQHVLSELNRIYHCQERHCNTANVDCGLGYYTRVDGVCQCVCPEGYDVSSNCAELENENSGPTEWPDVPFTIHAAEKDVCPPGFKVGYIAWDATDAYEIIRGVNTGPSTSLNITMCSRDANSTNTDMDLLPMGEYAVVKPAGLNCNGGLNLESNLHEVGSNFVEGGTLGDWTIVTDRTPSELMTRVCFRRDRDIHYPLEFPRQTPFRLLKNSRRPCVNVKGMRSRVEWYQYNMTDGRITGQTFCTFYPATYGCNQQITLNSTNRKQIIETPGFSEGKRENNRRCLYSFNVPKEARVKITMDKFDIDPEDFFHIRRFNKWSKAYFDFPKNFKRQFISEKDFMFLEYWSGPNDSDKDGIKLTAEVILKEDHCVNKKDKGRTYTQGKWVSEDFEECVPWKDTLHCEKFQLYSDYLRLLTSSNECRNPGGVLPGPWCFVSADRGTCRKKLCDVCHHLNDTDQLTNCNALMTDDPDFCTKALQRTKCARTCDLKLNSQPAISNKCTLQGDPKEYKLNERVRFPCSNGKRPYISCTLKGFTLPNCQDDVCQDVYPNCPAILSELPDVCTGPRSTNLMKGFCAKSCGYCEAECSFCEEPTNRTYSRTSADSQVTVSSIMELSCNDSFYHVSGDLRRVCGADGQLLGEEPVCQANPNPKDVGVRGVVNRIASNPQPRRRAFLFDIDGFRIPYDGQVTHWHFYAKKQGLVYFSVFRKDAQRDTYSMVGSNTINVETINEKWTSYVPLFDRIQVLKDDVYAFYSPTPGVIASNTCDRAAMKIQMLRTETATTFDELTFGAKAFEGTSCIIPSVGLRVAP